MMPKSQGSAHIGDKVRGIKILQLRIHPLMLGLFWSVRENSQNHLEIASGIYNDRR